MDFALLQPLLDKEQGSRFHYRGCCWPNQFYHSRNDKFQIIFLWLSVTEGTRIGKLINTLDLTYNRFSALFPLIPQAWHVSILNWLSSKYNLKLYCTMQSSLAFLMWIKAIYFHIIFIRHTMEFYNTAWRKKDSRTGLTFIIVDPMLCITKESKQQAF